MSNKPPANGEVFTTVENRQMNLNSSSGKDVFSRSKALLEQNEGKTIGKDPVTREDRKNERDATRKRALSNMEKEKALSNTEEEKESKKPRPENGSNESRHCLPFDFHHVLKAMQALTPVARADVVTTSIETPTQNDNITTPVDETLPKQKDDTTTADVATTEIETPPKQKEDTTEIETPTQNENTTTADVVDTNDAMTTTSRKYILEQTWMPKEICFIVVCDKCETKLVGTNKKKCYLRGEGVLRFFQKCHRKRNVLASCSVSDYLGDVAGDEIYARYGIYEKPKAKNKEKVYVVTASNAFVGNLHKEATMKIRNHYLEAHKHAAYPPSCIRTSVPRMTEAVDFWNNTAFDQNPIKKSKFQQEYLKVEGCRLKHNQMRLKPMTIEELDVGWREIIEIYSQSLEEKNPCNHN